MAMQSNHRNDWIDGTLEDCLLALAIIAMVVLPPLLVLFYR